MFKVVGGVLCAALICSSLLGCVKKANSPSGPPGPSPGFVGTGGVAAPLGGSGGVTPVGSSGTTGSSGATGSGTTGSGGTIDSGGGGTTGSSGATSNGGTTGSSGATGSSGTTSSGGTTGGGGSTGSDPTVATCVMGVMAAGITVTDCETCLCQVGNCQPELMALQGDAKGNALVSCSKAHTCTGACCLCGTSSKGGTCATDYSDFGMGPCGNEVQAADGKTPEQGVQGAIDNGTDVMTNCVSTGPDATNSCTKALKLSACAVDKCKTECPAASAPCP